MTRHLNNPSEVKIEQTSLEIESSKGVERDIERLFRAEREKRLRDFKREERKYLED